MVSSTTAQLFLAPQAIEAHSALCVSVALVSDLLQRTNFCVLERYHCFTDRWGQVRGAMEFIVEGLDLFDGVKKGSMLRALWKSGASSCAAM